MEECRAGRLSRHVDQNRFRRNGYDSDDIALQREKCAFASMMHTFTCANRENEQKRSVADHLLKEKRDVYESVFL